MRREPSLTFDGALRILGKHEHKTIGKIDKLLGGVILGGGAVAGAVALGVTPLEPVAAFGLVWGWVEQEGLAIGLLKSAVDAVSWKVSVLQGYERRELIAAAHSTIVVAALFESLQNKVGEEFYRRLKITDDEKLAVIEHIAPERRRTVVSALYAFEIPAPSAARGFEENVGFAAAWQAIYSRYLAEFIEGLAVAEDAQINWDAVKHSAVERYRSRYIELAARVPEFAIWAQLGEHAATRTVVRKTGGEMMDRLEGLGTAIRELNADVMTGLNANREVLNRVEALLSAGMRGIGGHSEASTGGLTVASLSGLRHTVSRANAGILEEKILTDHRARHPAGLEIPRVSEIYVNPRYRVATFDEQAQPADERWWENRESRDDFDIFLARHVTSPDATRRPLLLLGHPGAGKSLLTKVFAARLPTSEYTVVRVPLRRVGADAAIHHQIEEALDISTHQRIAWSDLAEQSGDTVRVVLLDGLDELLQASEHDRRGYLEAVMDFQELESVQQRPVVVVVTSRTVVADRVRVPDDTTIVKLDSFNDDDIASWLGRWKRVNADAIATGTVGELTLSAVRRQPELAEQPLLLLMLALYAADPGLPQLDEEMATAELYRLLLDGFAQREASKDFGVGHDPSSEELKQRMRDHLDRLTIAALGMFNRGRQDISEEALGKDLEALDPRLMERSRHAEAGRGIIGEFFFVHAPEAKTTAQRGRNEQPQRAYEFLHATFGEYLVARRIMDELIDVAVKAFSGRRGRDKVDDDLLFALLSHQVLAARQSMLRFALQIFAALDNDTARQQVLETLEVLISTYRDRHGSGMYGAYRPVPPDQVRQLACYSANLVALRMLEDRPPSGIPLAEVLRVSGPPQAVLNEWRITPLIWRAGLDSDGLRAMLSLIEMLGSSPGLYGNKSDLSLIPSELLLARLVGDETTEKRLRYGTAIYDEVTYYHDAASWADMMSSWLIPAIAGIGRVPELLPVPPEDTSDEDIAKVAKFIFKYLRSTSYYEPWYKRVLQLLFDMPTVFEMDELALTAAVIGRPNLRDAVPELRNFDIYGHYAEVVRRADRRHLTDKTDITNWKAPSAHVLYAVEDVLRKPLDLRKDE